MIGNLNHFHIEYKRLIIGAPRVNSICALTKYNEADAQSNGHVKQNFIIFTHRICLYVKQKSL